MSLHESARVCTSLHESASVAPSSVPPPSAPNTLIFQGLVATAEPERESGRDAAREPRREPRWDGVAQSDRLRDAEREGLRRGGCGERPRWRLLGLDVAASSWSLYVSPALGVLGFRV